jgi:hypothetical protein
LSFQHQGRQFTRADRRDLVSHFNPLIASASHQSAAGSGPAPAGSETGWPDASRNLRWFRLDPGIVDTVPASGNTTGMKVAVSIPDEVFTEAEALAKHLRASRSEIYSRALGEYLGRHAPDRVTDQMNHVMAGIGEETDSFSKRAGRRVLRRVEW